MKCFVGIDLASYPKNPTGWACLQGKSVETRELFSDEGILHETFKAKPNVVAIDAPLTLPRSGVTRKADRDMHRYGYHVLPPLYPAMKALTYRGIGLAQKIREGCIEVIEVHPASTRRAWSMPIRDWKELQRIFVKMGVQVSEKPLTAHQIDAVTAALTAYLHIKGDEEKIGDNIEGYIIVPKKRAWGELRL